MREVLEECGVLYARVNRDQALTHDAAQRRHWQKRLHDGESFAEVLQRAGLQVDTQHLAPWSRWITPMQPSVTNKRFDTRFFIAVLPQGQHPVHDNIEAIDSVWLGPREALERSWAGGLPLAPPQIMTLVSLLSHHSTTSVLNSATMQVFAHFVIPVTLDIQYGNAPCQVLRVYVLLRAVLSPWVVLRISYDNDFCL